MKTIFTQKLGLFGWNKYEPLLLAALTNELPILLIGKHGSAKSYLLEQLSKSLNMNYKFYNASLIDYDDLVGIPIPTEDKKSLTYINTNTAIWDAEVVFIDEVNRTKPELQNKLFPIIYEKRVQGQNLEKLKYRWAAMNPSYDEDSSYLGTMPLDDALADRFGFIIDVPSWDELNEDDRLEILKDQYNANATLDINLNELIKETKKEYEKQKLVLDEITNNIVMDLMKVLHKQYGYFSARRATIIKDALIATHAARIILNKYSEEKDKITLEDTAYKTIPYVLPNRANEEIDEETVFKAIKIAVESNKLNETSKKFMLMEDPLAKLEFGFKHIEEISHYVVFESLPTLIKDMDDENKLMISYFIALKIKEYPDAPAAIVETFYKLSKPLFELDIKLHRFFRGFSDSVDYEYLDNLAEEDETLKGHIHNLVVELCCEFRPKQEKLDKLIKTFTYLYKELINE